MQYSQLRGKEGMLLFSKRGRGGKLRSTVDWITQTWPVWGANQKIRPYSKKLVNRWAFSGSGCSEISGNGQTGGAVPSEPGMTLSQIVMESVDCIIHTVGSGLTEVVLPHDPSAAMMVSLSATIWSDHAVSVTMKGINYLFAKMNRDLVFVISCPCYCS